MAIRCVLKCETHTEESDLEGGHGVMVESLGETEKLCRDRPAQKLKKIANYLVAISDFPPSPLDPALSPRLSLTGTSRDPTII